jgi:hypothetical protein
MSHRLHTVIAVWEGRGLFEAQTVLVQKSADSRSDLLVGDLQHRMVLKLLQSDM